MERRSCEDGGKAQFSRENAKTHRRKEQDILRVANKPMRLEWGKRDRHTERQTETERQRERLKEGAELGRSQIMKELYFLWAVKEWESDIKL